MPVNESIAYYDPGNDITCHVEASVTGRHFVMITDPKQAGSLGLADDTLGGNPVVSPCTAGAAAFGVATYDAATGTKVPVMRGHKVVDMNSGAAISAGAKVMSDGTGRVIPWVTAASEANEALGICLNTVAGADAAAVIALNI